MDQRTFAGFDAAMIAVHRLVARDDRILKISGFLLGDEKLDVLVQRSLIAFERDDVVGLLAGAWLLSGRGFGRQLGGRGWVHPGPSHKKKVVYEQGSAKAVVNKSNKALTLVFEKIRG